MKRLIPILGVLVLATLVACQASTPETATPQREPSLTPTKVVVVPEPTSTSVTGPATPTPKATRDQGTPTAVPSSGAPPTPTSAWQIPEIREGDWLKGGGEAGMVIVEYSDFQ